MLAALLLQLCCQPNPVIGPPADDEWITLAAMRRTDAVETSPACRHRHAHLHAYCMWHYCRRLPHASQQYCIRSIYMNILYCVDLFWCQCVLISLMLSLSQQWPLTTERFAAQLHSQSRDKLCRCMLSFCHNMTTLTIWYNSSSIESIQSEHDDWNTIQHGHSLV